MEPDNEFSKKDTEKSQTMESIARFPIETGNIFTVSLSNASIEILLVQVDWDRYMCHFSGLFLTPKREWKAFTLR